MAHRLQEKVALITGSASGIGKSIAQLFLEEGARVVIADLNFEAAQACAKELDATGKNTLPVAMDVTDEAQVNAGVQKVVDAWGGIDCLISNAGIQIIAPIHELAFSQWKKLLAIHLDGAFLTTKAVLPHMQKKKSGSIIYMGSIHSKVPSLLKAAYVTAKHGLLGLARVVAKEGAPFDIRANVICPGFVRTPLVDKQIPEQAKTLGISEADVIKNIMLKETVDGEFTTLEDVAQTALLFASFKTKALTGQSLLVTHGWCME